jgi:DNA-binding SARP family transcriptional activator
MSSAAALEIHLLGRMEVLAGNAAIRIGGRHAQALMALLALRPRPRLRDTLAAELWPEAGSSSAASLRQALWLIRSTITTAGLDAERWLDTDQETIGLQRGVALTLDVDSFEDLATRDDAGACEEAIRLYSGDLLEGLGHECFAADRERLSDLYEDVLARVAQDRLTRGDVVGARRAASELLSRDPLREEAHAVLIAAYGRAGSRSQVIRQYRRLCSILDAELAVRPLPETDAVYRIALGVSAARSLERARDLAYEFEPHPFSPVLVTSA